MNNISTTFSTVLQKGALSGVLVVAVLAALFAFEAAPVRFATDEAHAASECSISATGVQVGNALDVTLQWQSAANAAYVTIDGVTGQQFAPTDSYQLQVTETTTFRARTHSADGSEYASCSATVRVQEQEQQQSTDPNQEHEPGLECEPNCDDTDMWIEAFAFGWTGEPGLTAYEVVYCDGSTSGCQEGCWGDDAYIEFDKELAFVEAWGEDCYHIKERECTPDEPEEPVAPACPYTDSNTTTVIVFEEDRLRSDYGASDAETIRYPVALESGTYKVESLSWDGYLGRENHDQPSERWYVDFLSSDSSVAVTPATSDLDDFVVEDSKEDTLVSDLDLSENVDSLVVRHAVYPNADSPNSVIPICVAITAIEDTPAPACEMSAKPLSVEQGESAQISWSSSNATGVAFTNLSSSDLSGTATVTPATTTTYSAVFSDDAGNDATCSVTVTVVETPDDPAPVCTLTASPSRVNPQQKTTLSWTSNNAVSATISSLGTVELNGSQSVTIAQATVFTATFVDGDGDEAVCTTRVTLNGGGGSCLNCDDDEREEEEEEEETEPTILLSKNTVRSGFVTLDQVPYTGFEASPVMTVLFWLGVLALSAGIAYLVTMRSQLASQGTSQSVSTQPSNNTDDTQTATAVTVMRAPPSQPTAVASTFAAQEPDASTNVATLIEDLAHADNILLSPEATRLITIDLEKTNGSAHARLTELFEKAKSAYAREDGWILLSKERTATLLGGAAPATPKPEAQKEAAQAVQERPARVAPKSVVAAHASRQEVPTSPAPQPKARNNSTAKAAPAAPGDVTRFVELLIGGKQQETFAMLRDLLAKGTTAESFIGRTVNELDKVYKNRLEGNHSPSAELAQLTATWSNADFENVLGILVECIDYSYESSRIGTKVALAKALAHFAK